jgi:hypothetical protein
MPATGGQDPSGCRRDQRSWSGAHASGGGAAWAPIAAAARASVMAHEPGNGNDNGLGLGLGRVLLRRGPEDKQKRPAEAGRF